MREKMEHELHRLRGKNDPISLYNLIWKFVGACFLAEVRPPSR